MTTHSRDYTVVIGGAGFVGANLCARLAREGEHVVVADDLSRPGVEQNVAWLTDTFGAGIEFHRVQIQDRRALRPLLAEARNVFHLAAQVAVTTSLSNPARDFATNLAGTLCVLEELRRLAKPPFLLFTSTNKVYGSLADVELACRERRWEPVDAELRLHGLSEARALDFCTPYGCSKGGADQYVLDYARSFGVPAVVFRMSCIYGPHQFGTEDQGWLAHFAAQMLKGEPITLYGDGCQVRDILFVDDVVEAMLLARAHARSLSGTAFNIGGGPQNTVSLREAVDVLADLHGAMPSLHHEQPRQADQRYYVSDTRRFQAATGWYPAVAVADGIDQLYRWLTTGLSASATGLGVR